MDVPPELAFRNVEPTDTLKEHILRGIDGLEKVYDRVWARKAGKGTLPRFPDHDHGPRPAVIRTPASTVAAGM